MGSGTGDVILRASIVREGPKDLAIVRQILRSSANDSVAQDDGPSLTS
jgi:hypothetical protein